MTMEFIIGFALLLVAALAGVVAIIRLIQEEKRADALENIIFNQERIITDLELNIDSMEIENRRLKSKISMLKLELEDKKK